jgi:hypothetical protein
VFGFISVIVNHDGVVYSNSLGVATATVAARITRFDRDTGWKREEAC